MDGINLFLLGIDDDKFYNSAIMYTKIRYLYTAG